MLQNWKALSWFATSQELIEETRQDIAALSVAQRDVHNGAIAAAADIVSRHLSGDHRNRKLQAQPFPIET